MQTVGQVRLGIIAGRAVMGSVSPFREITPGRREDGLEASDLSLVNNI